MYLDTFYHTPSDGWSVDQFPDLDSDQTLILIFGTPDTDIIGEPIGELRNHYPNSTLAGCSTAGEIFGTTILDDALSVAAIRLEHSSLRFASAPVVDMKQSFTTGANIANQLDAPGLRGVLIFSCGLKVNGSELVRGVNSVLSEQIVVTGGLAGDGKRFEKTWVLVDTVPQAGMVTAVGFYGDRIKMGHGSKGGWDIFGVERIVTKSKNNILYELDGKPALELYKKYLGQRADGLPATGLLFPLALRTDTCDENSVVRTILAVGEQDQSITFAGDIPEGSRAQLMHANFDRLIDGAADAALMLDDMVVQGEPLLSIAISCVGRRMVLGERAEEEIEVTHDVLPTQGRQVGFYSYGEISPYTNGRCELHNQTMTLTTISES